MTVTVTETIVENHPEDFTWQADEEPHASRRREMLTKSYAPKLHKLMGSDWTTAYWVFFLFVIQLSVAYVMRNADILNLLVAAYCIGGTCNHSLALAMHELAHNLAFGCSKLKANRFLAYFANFPIGFPAASSFKKYHLLHHRKQGDEQEDTDLPTKWEADHFKGTVGKVVWLMLQPWMYGLRPILVDPMPMNNHELVNIMLQSTFNGAVAYFMGWKSLIYLIMSTFSGYGIHPISGHFIAEHYMFVKGYETYSYYGPLNFLTYNVGFHNEHHDFPNVPGRLLPEVTKTAPEFYNNLPCHHSWVKVLFDFATDPEMTLWNRIKRHHETRAERKQQYNGQMPNGDNGNLRNRVNN